MSKKLLLLNFILFFIISTVMIKSGEAAPRLTKTAKKSTKNVAHKIGTGIRFHRDNSAFEGLPFREGDLTYQFYYEYHEGIGYWQIGLGYTPSLDEVEKVITPQLSLIIKDRIYRAGIGVLKSYISDKDKNFEDTDIYYQFILGLSFPIKKFSLDLNGLYSFEKWRDFDFDAKDIEYSASISFTF